MNSRPPAFFLCNGADKPEGVPPGAKVLPLSHVRNSKGRNVNLSLPKFVDQVTYLPDRVLDLLEIAAYVFAADRLTNRGPRDAVEFHAWGRSMHFAIRVRDYPFWGRPDVNDKLCAALQFMTGDHEYTFEFSPGRSTGPASFFDGEEFAVKPSGSCSVVLFSGGLDSLAGTLERLRDTEDDLYLISHQSGQPSIKRTQSRLFEALKRDHPSRVFHFRFECGLAGGGRAPDESQRSRAFLFGSIAFALAQRLGASQFFAYENGVTSLNFMRRQDSLNARASRTTHPKTHALMSEFLSEVAGKPIKVSNPFCWRTKTDVFQLLDKTGGRNLIGSAVSCSATFKCQQQTTHCGTCFQCVDRRLAAHASDLADLDSCGLYAKYIIHDEIDLAARTTVVDYLRQADKFARLTDDAFYDEYLSELEQIVDYVGEKGESDAVPKLWKLCNRHGRQVFGALKSIQQTCDALDSKVVPGSLIELINVREYLKEDARRLAERISAILGTTIRTAFHTQRPQSEQVLNDHIDAELKGRRNDLRREFPVTSFALAKVVPDLEVVEADLFIEAKFVRKNTPPSKASDGIAADITKYPIGKFVLFVVYDPDGAIRDVTKFRDDFESSRDCLVTVVR